MSIHTQPAIESADNFQLLLESKDVRTRWFSNLPLLDAVRSAKTLVRMLHSTNKLPASPDKRLKLLEEVRIPLASLIPALERMYKGQPMPLREQGMRAAKLMIALNKQLLSGYRQIFQQPAGMRWLPQQRLYKSRQQQALHRQLLYAGELLASFHYLGEGYPQGIWDFCHRTFIQAHERGWLDESIEFIDSYEYDKINSSTPREEYKKILLRGLLPYTQLTLGQLHEIEGSLSEWLSAIDCTLDQQGPKTEQTKIFVRLNQGEPPFILNSRNQKQCNEECSKANLCLRIDTRTLAARLDNYLGRSTQESHQVRLANGQSISFDNLKLLKTTWCQPGERREKREMVRRQVDVAVGISALHHMTSVSRVLLANDIEPELENEALSSLSLQLAENELVAVNHDNPDVWDKAYKRPSIKKQVTELTKKLHQVSLGQRLVDGIVLDISRNGYRLLFPKESQVQLVVGELIGIHEPTSNSWKAGQIRWMEQGKDARVTVGVEIILERLVPVKLRIRQNGKLSSPQPCLLGQHKTDRPTLIMPHLPNVAGKQLLIEVEKNQTRIDLGKLLLSTERHDLFHFDRRLEPIMSDNTRPIPLTENYLMDVFRGKQVEKKKNKKHQKMGKGKLSLVLEGDDAETSWSSL